MEIRVPLRAALRTSYAVADARTKFRMASENPAKIVQVKAILDSHYRADRARRTSRHHEGFTRGQGAARKAASSSRN